MAAPVRRRRDAGRTFVRGDGEHVNRAVLGGHAMRRCWPGRFDKIETGLVAPSVITQWSRPHEQRWLSAANVMQEHCVAKMSETTRDRQGEGRFFMPNSTIFAMAMVGKDRSKNRLSKLAE